MELVAENVGHPSQTSTRQAEETRTGGIPDLECQMFCWNRA